jgi:outer membrane protein assembly factor BamB
MTLRTILVLGLLGLAACGGGADHPAAASATPTATATESDAPQPAQAAGARDDWPRFGYDAARTSHAPHGIPASRVGGLQGRRVGLPGTVDSSPIYLSGVNVAGAKRNVIVMTTTYGRTVALDAASARQLWQFQPGSYRGVAGSAQITTATPVSDRRSVYAASPDGRIHRLSLATGREVRSGGWPVSVTKDATHEKIASALNFTRDKLLVTTGGYIGDAPPYQGKVVVIDRRRGRITSVLNSLCSDRRRIIRPASCRSTESAIWGRAGAVVNPADQHIFATSSNGPFDGRTDWGDSVLELSASGKLLRHYTPHEQAQLEAGDIDLGSTSPALLPAGHPKYALQGGKDGKLRLLALPGSLHGVTGAAGRRLGGERQIVPAPGPTDVFTAIAVSGRTAYVATNQGTAAWRLSGGRLHRVWSNGTPGTSPVIAGGVLWVFDPNGALVAYRPGSGDVIHRFDAPSGHWNSPIVAGGRVYLPTGDANEHRTSGSLSVFG